MKTRLLLFSLAALTAQAADTQTIDLGNGTSVEVKDGKVSVKSTSSGGGNQSASSSVNSSSNGDGTTTATVTSERNGQRVTRTITIGKDGKVSLGDSAKPGASGLPAPAAESAPSKGGWMGVHTAEVPDAVRGQVDLPEGQGVVIEFLAKDGPAEKAGLALNDIILKVNGEAVGSVPEFRSKLAALKSGAQAAVDYMRKGKIATATVTLGQRPPEAPADDRVMNEAGRLLREMQNQKGGGSRRTVVVGPDGKTTVTESSSSSSSSGGSSSSSGGSGSDAFDALLKDPNVPEEMKAQLRRTKEEFQKLQDGAKP